MKTKNAHIEQSLYDLNKIQKKIKELAKEEAALKADIKAFMGPNNLLETTSFYVTLETRNTTSIDRDALMHDLGYEGFSKYQKRTEYQVMSIKLLVKSVKEA